MALDKGLFQAFRHLSQKLMAFFLEDCKRGNSRGSKGRMKQHRVKNLSL